MTDDPDPPARAVTEVLGQDGERLISSTGWIGTHPADSGDVAHLMIYPTGHGVAHQMRALAEGFGLAAALRGPTVTCRSVHITLDRDTDGRHVQLRDVAARLLTERPVTSEWASAARVRGYVMLTIGLDRYSGRARELESYLARGARLHMGLVALRLGP